MPSLTVGKDGDSRMSEMIMIIMEVIGTIAFAISGALIAVSCSLDLFGVTFLGCITAVGGGMLRDVLLGQCPPAIFSNTPILLLAAFTAVVVFVTAYLNVQRFAVLREKIERINNVFDAIGLGAFSVTGTEIACVAGFSDKVILAVLMGMITGVGGGIFRDVLVAQTPYVLKKHIYALASLGGSLLYYIIGVRVGNTVVGTVVATISVVLIRMLAAKYHWKLPKIKLAENEDMAA